MKYCIFIIVHGDAKQKAVVSSRQWIELLIGLVERTVPLLGT